MDGAYDIAVLTEPCVDDILEHIPDDLKICVSCHNAYKPRYFQSNPTEVDGRSVLCRGCVHEDKQRRKNSTMPPPSRVAVIGNQPTMEPMDCKKCYTQLPASFFSPHPHSKLGRRYCCLACRSELDSKRSETTIAIIPSEKVCHGPLCNGDRQPAESFSRAKHHTDGLKTHCKKCHNALQRMRSKMVKEVPYGSVAKEPAAAAGRDRLCLDCKKTKPAGEFPMSKYARSGRQTFCKECHSLRDCHRYAAKKAGRVAKRKMPTAPPSPAIDVDVEAGPFRSLLRCADEEFRAQSAMDSAQAQLPAHFSLAQLQAQFLSAELPAQLTLDQLPVQLSLAQIPGQSLLSQAQSPLELPSTLNVIEPSHTPVLDESPHEARVGLQWVPPNAMRGGRAVVLSTPHLI